MVILKTNENLKLWKLVILKKKKSFIFVNFQNLGTLIFANLNFGKNILGYFWKLENLEMAILEISKILTFCILKFWRIINFDHFDNL